MMIPVGVLLIWACLAAISVASHVSIGVWMLSGQEDRKTYVKAVAAAQAIAAQDGGVRKWIMMNLACDILMPWRGWVIVLRAYRDERG